MARFSASPMVTASLCAERAFYRDQWGLREVRATDDMAYFAADGNEEIVAFVQLIPGSPVNPAELMAYVKPQLTSYKRPSEIIALEALPATSTGKILKHKLAESLRGA